MDAQDFFGLFIIVTLVAITLGTGAGVRKFFRLRSQLTWHTITAVAWTLMTICVGGFELLWHTLAPNEVNVVRVFFVVCSGWAMMSCWRQLKERESAEGTAQRQRSVLARLYLQTLCGPLALIIAISFCAIKGQKYFEEVAKRGDVSTALLLQQFGIGATNTSR